MQLQLYRDSHRVRDTTESLITSTKSWNASNFRCQVRTVEVLTSISNAGLNPLRRGQVLYRAPINKLGHWLIFLLKIKSIWFPRFPKRKSLWNVQAWKSHFLYYDFWTQNIIALFPALLPTSYGTLVPPISGSQTYGQQTSTRLCWVRKPCPSWHLCCQVHVLTDGLGELKETVLILVT